VINDVEAPESSPGEQPKSKPVKKVATPVKKKKESAPLKKGTKRGLADETSRPQKRQKKQATPSDISEDEATPTELSSEDSAASSFDDSEHSEPSKVKKGNTKTKGKPKVRAKEPAKRGSKNSKVVDSDESDLESDELSEASLDDEDSEASAVSTPPTKKKVLAPKRTKKGTISKKQAGSEDSEQEASEDENASAKKETPKKASPKLKSSFTKPSQPDNIKADTTANDSDSSEMSIVLDEPAKPKRQRKDPSATKFPKTKKEAKAPKDLSESEAKIKTLQSQLVKCGVRKIWAFELKKYDNDGEKIRHLQGMLKEIGMTGRFSDQRAKEIKEMRELQADLDAVKEGESHWGTGSGTRRAKAPRRSLKENVGSDEESDEEEEQRSASEKPEEKAKAAKAELAFLGSESESD